MQQKVVQFLNKSGDCEFSIERELEQMHLQSKKSISVKLQNIKLNLIPSTKPNILLDHLEEFLLLVNTISQNQYLNHLIAHSNIF